MCGDGGYLEDGGLFGEEGPRAGEAVEEEEAGVGRGGPEEEAADEGGERHGGGTGGAKRAEVVGGRAGSWGRGVIAAVWGATELL